MREKYIFIGLMVGVLTFGLAGVGFSQVEVGVPPNVPMIAAPRAVESDSTFFGDPFFRPNPFFAPTGSFATPVLCTSGSLHLRSSHRDFLSLLRGLERWIRG